MYPVNYTGDMGGFIVPGIPDRINPRLGVTNAKLANVPNNTFKGNVSGIVANPADVTISVLAVAQSVFTLVPLTIPISSAFSTFNGTGNTLTVVDKSDRLQLNLSGSAVALAGLFQNSITAPYTIDIVFQVTALPAANTVLGGLCLSDGTKFMAFSSGVSVNVGTYFQQSWTTSSTGAVTVKSTSNVLPVQGSIVCLRITDDAATRKYYVSTDEKSFLQFQSEATNTFLTPTKFGMFMESTGGAIIMTVHHWLVSPSVLGDAA